MKPVSSLGAAAALSLVTISFMSGLTPPSQQEPAYDAPRVTPIVLVAAGDTVEPQWLSRHIGAFDSVRMAFARALHDSTFPADPFMVQVTNERDAPLTASAPLAWAGVQAALREANLPWRGQGRRKLLVIVQGGGRWMRAAAEPLPEHPVLGAGQPGAPGSHGGVVVLGDAWARACRSAGCGDAGDAAGAAYRQAMVQGLARAFALPAIGNATIDLAALGSQAAGQLHATGYFGSSGNAGYALLSHRRPSLVSGDVRFVNVDLGGADSLAWVDGAGGGTGYPWAVVVGAASTVRWTVDPPCAALVADVGVQRGAVGGGMLQVIAGSDTVARVQVNAGPPQVLHAHMCARTLSIVGSGSAGFRGVLGNVRIYAEESLQH